MAETTVIQLTGTTGGGAGRHARDLTGGLREHGYRALLAGPADVVQGVAAPTAVVDIADRPRPGDLQVIRQLRRLARGARIVHAHGLRAGAVAALALTGVPASDTALVVTLHNKPVGSAKVRYIGAVLERVVAARAQVVLGVSGDLVARARDLGVPHTERALVPAPFPPGSAPPAGPDRIAELRAALELDAATPVIVTLARLAPQKGLELLADAAALVRERVPAARWLVAGDGPLAGRLGERIAAQDLPVRLLGWREDGADLMALADVVVSTSAWEGQPLNVQEALRAGRPIVATDVGGTGEVTGTAALLVRYGDPDALAGQITAVLTDPELAADLGGRALARAARLPSRQDTLEQVQRCYCAVLG